MNEFVDFSKELARASGDIIKRYFRSGVAVETKDDDSPVTIADRQAEEIMREMIMKAYPDHGIIGEEFGNYNEDAEYQWVLDPIDGTKSFVSGTFLFRHADRPDESGPAHRRRHSPSRDFAFAGRRW